MFALRPILLPSARLTPVAARPSIARDYTFLKKTMATESPSKRLKMEAPVIGTHK
jgi:hypothetical protein